MEKTERDSYIKAGKIAKEVVDYARSFIKPGMLLIEIAEKIDKKILDLGAEPAFPVNLSLNEIAAHYTPGKKDLTKAEGLLCVDLGVAINGCIADTAFSLDLSENKEYEEMIKLNEKVLSEALKIIKSGIEIGEIGTKIQNLIDEHNKKNNTHFSVIKNLTGHSLGENEIHAGLTIPNYRNTSNIKLNNVAIAIEPFLTTGIGEIYEGKESEIYRLQRDGQVRDRDARELLNFIKEKYLTLPFCKRWLEGKFKKLDFSLSTLKKQGIIHNYPVLIEKSKKPVSQAEHTIIIDENITITTA